MNLSFPNIKRSLALSLPLASLALLSTLTACSSTQASATPTTTNKPAQHLPVVALPDYQVSLFASATKDYKNPDAVVADNGHIFIDYQNVTAKDGSDSNTKSSTVVEYSMDGKVQKTFSVPGHSDGMRVDPSTHLLWTTSNEDSNPRLATIDPNSGAVTAYQFPPTVHGGGYDDLYFLNGLTFLSASNPTLDKSGTNVFPALYTMTLGKGKVNLTPVLKGNDTATDAIANSKVTLNEIDPDSLSTNGHGDLVLVNQAGSELLILHNPGTKQQQVGRIPVGSQLDDTVWTTSTKGRLLITDATSGNTYWIRSNFKLDSVFTETPDDSGVSGIIGQVDLGTGFVHTIAIGMSKPTGMIFVPDGQ